MTQQLIVIAIVVIAGGWLAWRWWRSLRGRRGSCGCDGCPRDQRKSP